jgi:ubiquinone/menaquinone biosynthesis C-methylase UbiE
MTEPEAHRSVLREYFGRTADYWHGLYEGEAFINRHMADRRALVLRLIEKYSNGAKMRILDLGSGTGIITLDLIKKGGRVVALDCTREMIFKLKGEMGGVGNRTGQGLVGDGEMTCFKDGTFDAVVCIGVMQYQKEDDVILREIGRLLRPKGFCVFSIPNIMRLSYMVDPLYCFRLINRSLKRLRTQKISNENGSLWDADRGDTTDRSYPINRKYVMWQLNKELEKEYLRIREIVGFGFGPLSFWGKPIVLDHASWRISKFLDRYANRWKFLKALSNRWLFVVEKQ